MRFRDDAPGPGPKDLRDLLKDVLRQSAFGFTPVEERDPLKPEVGKAFRLCGEDLLGDRPMTQMLSTAIAHDLLRLTGTDEHVLVEDLLMSFSRWVSVLPASENNHHSGPFGLLQHSIQVAWLFLSHLLVHPENRKLVGELDPEQRRLWLLAGAAAALLHDCGKLFDMEVRSITSGENWDPMREPVTGFIGRDEEPATVCVRVRFVPGRGLKGHEAKGRALIPLILPWTFREDLPERTLAVYDACAHHHEIPDPASLWPASWLAAVILTADQGATVAGGQSNAAQGAFSFVAGSGAVTTNIAVGSFVWADSAGTSQLTVTAANRFVARASGGVWFFSDAAASAGVVLNPGSGAWATLSDRNAKTHRLAVNGQIILDRLAAVPIETWSYVTEDSSIRHIGPMAQEFRAAFQVGPDDHHITTVDAEGVALCSMNCV
jgi:hypothetical protein